MRRYLLDPSRRDVRQLSADVIVVGSGAAGLYAALNLDPQLHCMILNKAGAPSSNSMYAQGGIASVIEPNPVQDDPEQHLKDTLVAGAGLCDENAVRVLVKEAWSNIEELISLGVPFDTQDGQLLLTREGGHGKNRILHCGGDASGFHLTSQLYETALKRDNIRIVDNMFLTDILTDDHGVTGVMAIDAAERIWHIASPSVVIASGGIGRIYRNSTNAVCATGDGIAAAQRAGAQLMDMEFVQFHPTAFVYPDDNGRFFLISEALRGEGAILRNRRWEAFMQGKHPLADLAPRDIVSRFIIQEMKKYDIPHVYLDITSRPRSFLKNRFPTIYSELMRRGIDMAKNWIPVMPVQHYFMGGIHTDIDAHTNVPGLYACGEAARTGVHGANRLASNSLLECLVFGRRCAYDINQTHRALSEDIVPEIKVDACPASDEVDFDSYASEIRSLMTQKCSIIRNEKDLTEAYEVIHGMFLRLDALELNTQKGMETYNMAEVASAVLEAALERKTSVGAHYRSDAQ